MIPTIKNAFHGLAKNKLLFLFFFITSWIFGVAVQLSWIHQYCAGYPIWGADVAPCRENTYRIIFGGPLGVVILLLIFFALFALYAAASRETPKEVLARGLLLALTSFGFAIAAPLLSYTHTNLIHLISLLLFGAILAKTLKAPSIQVLHFLQKIFYQKSLLRYTTQLDSGALTIQFVGQFSPDETTMVFEQLILDLTELPVDVKSVHLILEGAEGFSEDYAFIFWILQGYASMKKVPLRLVADTAQKKVVGKENQRVEKDLKAREKRIS